MSSLHVAGKTVIVVLCPRHYVQATQLIVDEVLPSPLPDGTSLYSYLREMPFPYQTLICEMPDTEGKTICGKPATVYRSDVGVKSPMQA